MKKLFKQHYQAIVKRGLITPNTELYEFSNKINEEKGELSTELLKLIKGKQNNYKQEAIDLICATMNLLIHNNVDIEKELIKNIKIQEERCK